MTVISLIDLRPAAKGVYSPIADQALALDALTDAESEPAHLPDLAGGQFWLIEISPTNELSTLHRKIVTESNVIIYDRSLEAIVAEALPLGGYAEPDSSAQAAQRCVRFVRDGWSVVRLVDRQTPAAGGPRICRTWRGVGRPSRQANRPSFCLPERVGIAVA
jgi:hypothetical protein